MPEAQLATRMAHHMHDGSCKTLAELSSELGLSHSYTHITVRLLMDKGLIKRTEEDCYQLTDDGLHIAHTGASIQIGPFKIRDAETDLLPEDTLFQRAWSAMRIMGKFTVADIAMVAAKDGDENALKTIGRFLHRLSVTGYVHGFKARRDGFKRWKLIDDTGEIAPAFKKGGGAFDRNTGELRL